MMKINGVIVSELEEWYYKPFLFKVRRNITDLVVTLDDGSIRYLEKFHDLSKIEWMNKNFVTINEAIKISGLSRQRILEKIHTHKKLIYLGHLKLIMDKGVDQIIKRTRNRWTEETISEEIVGKPDVPRIIGDRFIDYYKLHGGGRITKTEHDTLFYKGYLYDKVQSLRVNHQINMEDMKVIIDATGAKSTKEILTYVKQRKKNLRARRTSED